MIQGTMSGAGKSLLVAGLCRILKEDGVKVAPFKSQNMALNSYITKEGLEMGRAQVVQAEAAGIEPSVLMNPILLKPTDDTGSQVIINGEVIGNMSARDYFSIKRDLVPYIKEAYEALSQAYDVIVIEGAGSPAEINLKNNDIVNMGMAKIAKAPVLLVGDIDRGGVFAQLYGTVELLDENEQKRVKGLLINKFRGDESILEPGVQMLERKMHKKVVGTIPYMEVDIEEEDSISERFAAEKKPARIHIDVIRLPHISNYTDLAPLEHLDDIGVRYVSQPAEIDLPDLIIIPGSKNTIGDFMWLRESGMEERILHMHKQGTMVFGICGGYQMLGMAIHDPIGIEFAGSINAMGLLPVETYFEEEKTRTQVQGKFQTLVGPFEKLSQASYEGYEIHMGQTKAIEPVRTLMQNDGRSLGCCKGRVAGTYVHGIFDKGEVTSAILEILADQKGIRPEEIQGENFSDYKEIQYQKLAQELRERLDMKRIYAMIEQGEEYDGHI